MESCSRSLPFPYVAYCYSHVIANEGVIGWHQMKTIATPKFHVTRLESIARVLPKLCIILQKVSTEPLLPFGMELVWFTFNIKLHGTPPRSKGRGMAHYPSFRGTLQEGRATPRWPHVSRRRTPTPALGPRSVSTHSFYSSFRV